MTEVPLFTQVDLTGRIDMVGNPPLTLPRYDKVCRAVRKLNTVDEVDGIIARAEAVRAYAKQARNRQLELDAAEIRIRAERRLGELMQGAARTFGKAKPPGANQYKDRVATKPEAPPTLAEAGIDKNLAHRARWVSPGLVSVVLSAAKDLAERSDTGSVASVRPFAALRMTECFANRDVSSDWRIIT